MYKYLTGPSRTWAYLAMVVLLASALLLVSCSEKQSVSTAPEQAVALSAADLSRVMAVQDRHTPDLLAIDGVVGTATGLSAVGKPVVKVYAERAGVAGIPAMLGGIPVEVEVTGRFEAFALTGRYRPVPIGVSVGNNNECAAGTIGCVVFKGGNPHILSNNHVLARINAAAVGEPIVQPGRYDNKPKCANRLSTDKVAELTQFVSIKFDGSCNTVDAAIARYTTGDFSCATLSGFYGTPSATTVTATVGLGIKKVGRTTELTTGSVSAINATVNVNYGVGVATFCGQIVTTKSFSKSGDSGSLVVTNNSSNNPVGLLFAGSRDGTTILNPIDAVLSSLSVSICGN
jgi:hypothetical protein